MPIDPKKALGHEFPESETYPGLLVLRFDSGLFFASSDALEDRLRELALQADPPLHTIVLSFEGINFIDSQGSYLITQLVERLPDHGVELRLTRVKAQVQSLLKFHGLERPAGTGGSWTKAFWAWLDELVEPGPLRCGARVKHKR